MIFDAKQINNENFDIFLPELINNNFSGVYDYKFLLEVCTGDITDDQEDILKPYIVDRFITEQFEEAEWEGRFQLLEDAKEIYVKDMCFPESEFMMFKIANCQSIFISKSYHKNESLDTLVIPVNLFKESDLAPMEIIVYILKMDWNKSYSTIARMLNRNHSTIRTTFMRAVDKMESD